MRANRVVRNICSPCDFSNRMRIVSGRIYNRDPMENMHMSQTPPEDEDVDFDALAIEQMKNDEPDELDGPAWDLDRALDGESDD
jgi:hypothetical protein